MMLDVAIIGCGIIGANVAYLLSQTQLKVAVLEKENDVSMGTTRANSAIVHAGYDPAPGSAMAKLNVRGSALTKEQCAAFHVGYRQIGSLVLAFHETELATLQKLYENGVASGVPDLQILSAAETLALEPNLAPDVQGALLAPSAAVVEPWDLCLALAGAAVQNGVELKLETAVQSITKTGGGYLIRTNKGDIIAKTIVNAAGTMADVITNMVAPANFVTMPSRGEYYLLDKSAGGVVNHVIFQCPNKDGKGVLIAPTVHGNLIVGPNAEQSDREDTATTTAGLAFVKEKAVKSVPHIAFRDNIRNFAGVRANTDRDDFIMEETIPGFITLGGIKSPGLSSAPAIAEVAAEMLQKAGLAFVPRKHCVTSRNNLSFNALTTEEKIKAVAQNPLYGRVICRCETITEGEILDALKSPIPPTTVDGVKRRCGAGMGRCQGGFCGPRVHEILARECRMKQENILKDRAGSVILTGRTKMGKAGAPDAK
ncbi:MAG: NAD(P)/FAD-dependent oxidoreductase [Ruthenibacterium sp.]